MASLTNVAKKIFGSANIDDKIMSNLRSAMTGLGDDVVRKKEFAAFLKGEKSIAKGMSVQDYISHIESRANNTTSAFITEIDKGPRKFKVTGESRHRGSLDADLLNSRNPGVPTIKDRASIHSKRGTNFNSLMEEPEDLKSIVSGKPHTLEERVDKRIFEQNKKIAEERLSALEKSNNGTLTPQEIKKLGLTGKAQEEHAGIIGELYDNKVSKIKDYATVGDRMVHYQIPQKVAAVGGTAWLVSAMAESKGHMSNSELYGQRSPYGGGGGA